MNEITVELVNALREFSGEGIMSCKKALTRADGDICLAAGYLRASGCLIYTEDRQRWEESYAQSWVKGLEFKDGKLDWSTK